MQASKRTLKYPLKRTLKKALNCQVRHYMELCYGPYIQGSTGTKRELVLD